MDSLNYVAVRNLIEMKLEGIFIDDKRQIQCAIKLWENLNSND